MSELSLGYWRSSGKEWKKSGLSYRKWPKARGRTLSTCAGRRFE